MTELRQFLGLQNYCQRFILRYARVAAPLTDLLRGKSSSLQFSTAQIQDFQELKNYLVLAPDRKVYDPDLPIQIQSDASKLAVGAIFLQLNGGNWHLVEYFSKHLNDAEIQYCATEREMLGCILDLQCWWQYIIGKQFDVLTNHTPNQYILFYQRISRYQVHWVKVLVEKASNFIYKPGRIHLAPDALSCTPDLNAVLDIHDNDALLEAINTAKLPSQDKQFLQFRHVASDPSSDFPINNSIVVKKIANNCPSVIPGDPLALQWKVLEELHISLLGGHLGYRKNLDIVRARFWVQQFNQ